MKTNENECIIYHYIYYYFISFPRKRKKEYIVYLLPLPNGGGGEKKKINIGKKSLGPHKEWRRHKNRFWGAMFLNFSRGDIFCDNITLHKTNKISKNLKKRKIRHFSNTKNRRCSSEIL